MTLTIFAYWWRLLSIVILKNILAYFIILNQSAE